MQTVPHHKPRLMVMTDLSNEPDDEESFVRLLVYSDQFDIEGLIATTSAWMRREFPKLFHIVTPSNPGSHLESYRGAWNGISSGRGEQTAAGYHFDMVDNPWLEANATPHLFAYEALSSG